MIWDKADGTSVPSALSASGEEGMSPVSIEGDPRLAMHRARESVPGKSDLNLRF